jgi:transposase
MRNSTLFNQLLGVTLPWSVRSVVSDMETKTVNVHLSHRRAASFPCPDCGSALPVYDHAPARSWRHLDCGPLVTMVHARVPRVSCPQHGVRRVEVSWALPRCQFTRAFERWAIDILREADVQGATRLLRISWDEAWHLLERAVQRGQRRKQRRMITHLGVDEKAIAKGHTYFTLVCDLNRATVEYVAEDRKQTSLDGWNYRRRGWGERHWKHWYWWATHARLPAMVKAARTIRNHLPQVLNYFAHRITNALSEGMNSRIQEIKKTPTATATRTTSRWPSISIAAALISTPITRADTWMSPQLALPGMAPTCPSVQ